MSGIGSITDENDLEKSAVMYADHHLFPDASENLIYPFDAEPEFGTLQELAEGVYRFRMPLPFSLDHINLYILDDGDGWVIVDTGLKGSRSAEVWQQVFDDPRLKGRPVHKIIVTHYHPDHVGSAGCLAEKTGAPLYMTRNEYLLAQAILASSAEHPPEFYVQFYGRAGIADQALNMMRSSRFDHFASGVGALPPSFIRLWEGEKLTIGKRTWRIVMGAGHSPEHACLYSEEDRILISGDQILPRITSNVSVYPMEPMANPLGQWIGSLQKLRRLDMDTLVLPAHNEPFKGLHTRVDQIMASHMRRLHKVWDVIATECTGIGLFPALFKRHLKGIDFIMGLGEALAHVHHLERKGLATRQLKDGMNYFKQAGTFDPMLVMGDKEHV